MISELNGQFSKGPSSSSNMSTFFFKNSLFDLESILVLMFDQVYWQCNIPTVHNEKCYLAKKRLKADQTTSKVKRIGQQYIIHTFSVIM